jgi:hypothetical protein
VKGSLYRAVIGTEAHEREVARRAGEQYGTMAANLSLVQVSTASSEEAVQDDIRDLARNVRQQAEN